MKSAHLLTSIALIFSAQFVSAETPVQETTVGKNGVFQVETSWGVDQSTQMDFLRGRVGFTPNQGVICPSIRAVQVARVQSSENVDFNWESGNSPRNQMRTENDPAQQLKPGYFVDHDPFKCLDSKNCSEDYRDSWANSDESSDGFRLADGSFHEASLVDYPYGWDRFGKISLEACMICTQTAEIYGCYDWGGEWPLTGPRKILAPHFHETPSKTFNRARVKFREYYQSRKRK